ncbi:hypothetical protein HPB48_018285 [Haemaphysalis longicornis]|uniref:ABC transporter domain-containing protein n=1 Tax=Haemaphysalis longicornis TaxID=44386 RepID=A0A9J6G9A5_HAELO|nr:hypothetical protein HPB48_018285 [Haemaphysalis longicornis]
MSEAPTIAHTIIKLKPEQSNKCKKRTASLILKDKWSYWIPRMTLAEEPARSLQEVENFEQEPREKLATIELIHASKIYDGVVAVHDVSLRIYENQITVLLGHNGAGKTTVLNMITGFVDCSTGKVLVGGYDINVCTRDARESTGYCPQNNILFDELTVEQHAMFFAIVKGIPRSKVCGELDSLLSDLDLNRHRKRIVSTLSVGQQRRLSALLAVIGSPKVIVMDEPTANMDPDERRSMWELLLEVRRGRTILLTTQYLEEADVLGDRIAVMANGQIRYSTNKCHGYLELLSLSVG